MIAVLGSMETAGRHFGPAARRDGRRYGVRETARQSVRASGATSWMATFHLLNGCQFPFMRERCREKFCLVISRSERIQMLS